MSVKACRQELPNKSSGVEPPPPFFAPTWAEIREVAPRSTYAVSGGRSLEEFGDTALALRVRAGDIAWQMSCTHFRKIVIRRVRLREDLKPVKAHWHRGPVEPDWLIITHVTGQRGHDFFDLQSIKVWSLVVATLTGSISYETLPIAKGQAHADVGVEYVEWEPCNVEITNPDGSIDWGRAVPSAEPGVCT